MRPSADLLGWGQHCSVLYLSMVDPVCGSLYGLQHLLVLVKCTTMCQLYIIRVCRTGQSMLGCTGVQVSRACSPCCCQINPFSKHVYGMSVCGMYSGCEYTVCIAMQSRTSLNSGSVLEHYDCFWIQSSHVNSACIVRLSACCSAC